MRFLLFWFTKIGVTEQYEFAPYYWFLLSPEIRRVSLPLLELRVFTFYLKSTYLTTQVACSKIMAPIVKTLPSYIKNNQHALEIFPDFSFLGQSKLIFTMDTTSLYTVIPNDEGLALKHFFDHRTVKEPSSETLLRLAELVLIFNCFSFGGNYYKQTNGVAMGIKMGPSYANLF